MPLDAPFAPAWYGQGWVRGGLGSASSMAANLNAPGHSRMSALPEIGFQHANVGSPLPERAWRGRFREGDILQDVAVVFDRGFSSY